MSTPADAQDLERIARVPDLVAIATGSGNRDQVVVHYEDLQRRFAGEGVEDPAIELAADLTVVEIRF